MDYLEKAISYYYNDNIFIKYYNRIFIRSAPADAFDNGKP